MTDFDVAVWMMSQFKNSWLYQDVTVYEIENKFGNQFVYANDNGNLAISKGVLKEFRKLNEGKVIWERGEKAWRLLSPTEQTQYQSRQVE